MGSVLVVGSINHDTLVRLERRPAPGETVLAHDWQDRPGGKGANQAVAAARAGARVAMVGAVGDDERGRTQLAALREEGVDVGGVATSPDVPTGLAIVTVTPDGENAIVVVPGANARVAHVAGAADVVVGQTEIDPAAVAAAARLGGRFVLNAAPVVALDARTIAAADPLIVNEHEAAQLGSPDAAELRRITAARSVVVTRGAAGAVVADGEVTTLPAPAVEAIDTTGAGDVFVGTLAAALADGSTLIDAARRAVAAAAQSVTRSGAR